MAANNVTGFRRRSAPPPSPVSSPPSSRFRSITSRRSCKSKSPVRTASFRSTALWIAAENHGERRSAQVLHRIPDVLRAHRSARHDYAHGARRHSILPKVERFLSRSRRDATRARTARLATRPTPPPETLFFFPPLPTRTHVIIISTDTHTTKTNLASSSSSSAIAFGRSRASLRKARAKRAHTVRASLRHTSTTTPLETADRARERSSVVFVRHERASLSLPRVRTRESRRDGTSVPSHPCVSLAARRSRDGTPARCRAPRPTPRRVISRANEREDDRASSGTTSSSSSTPLTGTVVAAGKFLRVVVDGRAVCGATAAERRGQIEDAKRRASEAGATEDVGRLEEMLSRDDATTELLCGQSALEKD